MMKEFSGTREEWNRLLKDLPDPHLLQSWDWADFKKPYGWSPAPYIWENKDPNSTGITAAAMILKRTIPIRGFSFRPCILYIPKGPNLDWSDVQLRNTVLNDLQQFSKGQRSIFIKMDADIPLGYGVPGSSNAEEVILGQQVQAELKTRNWIFSNDQVQFRNTMLLDLGPSINEIEAQLKQKTRYNIHLAERKGVVIRQGNLNDLHLLYQMYAETSVRDGFVIRNQEYYHAVWTRFLSNSAEDGSPFARVLIAEFNNEPIAALFLFCFLTRAYYLYGMSSQLFRDFMPSYLLQWEAIKLARSFQCRTYDMWGAPDEFTENDPLWGVYRFKTGFGAREFRTIGAWDFPANRFLYRLYTRTIPGVLELMRGRGKKATRQSLGLN